MKQVRRMVITWGGGVNSALYYHPLIPAFLTASITAAEATVSVPAAGTIRNLCIQQLAAVGGGDAVTIRFDKNGSSTSLSVTITDPATSGSDTSNSVTFAAGDSFVVVRTGTGAPGAGTAMISWEWEPDDGVTSIYGFGGRTDVLTTSTYRDGLLDGGGDVNGWGGTADQAKTLIGLAGTITGYYVRLSAAPGAGDTRTFVIYKNGTTAQDGSGGTPDTRVTISDAATTGNVAFSLTTASGDYYHIQETSTGTPATTRANGSVTFESDVAGRWHVGAQCTNSSSDSTTEYLYPSGSSDDWSATETARQQIAGTTPFYLAGMIGRLQVAPGSGKALTFTLRKNQDGTAQALTFSNTDTSAATSGDAVLFETVADEISLQGVPSNTPTIANAFPKFAWYGYEVPASIVGTAVFGAAGTVTSSGTFLANMDGTTRTVHEPNRVVIWPGEFKLGVGYHGHVEVSLTNAEIKALRATPKTLVAAPGAGKVLEFVSAVLLLDYGGTNVFTETADNLVVRFNNTTGVIVSETIETTGFIDQSADTLTTALAKIDAIASKAGSENLALVLHNSGDGEIAGNAANDNTLRVKVAYRVWATGW